LQAIWIFKILTAEAEGKDAEGKKEKRITQSTARILA
jgi:hypothetical protein